MPNDRRPVSFRDDPLAALRDKDPARLSTIANVRTAADPVGFGRGRKAASGEQGPAERIHLPIALLDDDQSRVIVVVSLRRFGGRCGSRAGQHAGSGNHGNRTSHRDPLPPGGPYRPVRRQSPAFSGAGPNSLRALQNGNACGREPAGLLTDSRKGLLPQRPANLPDRSGIRPARLEQRIGFS